MDAGLGDEPGRADAGLLLDLLGQMENLGKQGLSSGVVLEETNPVEAFLQQVREAALNRRGR